MKDVFNCEIDYVCLFLIDCCDLCCMYCMLVIGFCFLKKE